MTDRHASDEEVADARTPILVTASRRLPGAYLLWLSGALISQVGDAALYFALGWAASATGGTSAGLVLSAVALPRTVLLLLGGVVGDRFGARRVMIIGDAVMLVLAVGLGIIASRWGTPLLLLVMTGLIVGVVDAFYLPSSGSMPRRLVDDKQLAPALALKQSGSQLVSMIGGPVGWGDRRVHWVRRRNVGRRGHLRGGSSRPGCGTPPVRPTPARPSRVGIALGR
jgi:Major Facilitator Superfamily